MSAKLSRRDFLKITGLGTAASALLVGGGPGDILLGSEKAGERRVYATTCGCCPAGCGLLVSVQGGRILEVRGNPAHPLNLGGICNLGTGIRGSLFNSERLDGPRRKAGLGAPHQHVDWEAGVDAVASAFERFRPSEIAFLLGGFPDYLYHLVVRLSSALGGAHVLRYGAPGVLGARVTLMDAAQRLFGVSRVPYFDLAGADVVFSFDAHFSEPWLAQASFWQGNKAIHRQGRPYLVHFSPQMSPSAALVDEWVPIAPGSQAFLVGALASLVGEQTFSSATEFIPEVDVSQAAAQSGISEAKLRELAQLFVNAPRKVAVPGAGAMGDDDGLTTAQAVLALNALGGNLGREGGLYLVPDAPLRADVDLRPSTFAEVSALVERLRAGKIKALFVHGVNPVKDLPSTLDFVESLKGLELLISFSSTLDETAVLADYVLPDHAPLESWGYQVVSAGGDRMAISALQPVVPPLYDSRASVDVLLTAARLIGGDLAAALPYRDEREFLREAVNALVGCGHRDDPSDLDALWEMWLQNGGWWTEGSTLMPPVLIAPTGALFDLEVEKLAEAEKSYPLRLLPYPNHSLYGAHDTQPDSRDGAKTLPSKPVEPWVEVHPTTACEFGVQDGELVVVASPDGETEARLHVTTVIVPGMVAVPLDSQVGSSVLDLLGALENDSGEFAVRSTRVKLNSARGVNFR